MRDSLLNLGLPPRLLPPLIVTSAALISSFLYIRPLLTRPLSSPPSEPPAPSPKWTLLPRLSTLQRDELPYPPEFLPGGRDVDTPYGSMRVYEWGDEKGEKVLLLHGIGTPCLALSRLARRLVELGYRVMLFDFFGRGYSDAPSPSTQPYNAALYTTQIHLALSSSPLTWYASSPSTFHLIGYSLGGAIAASFTAHNPNLVRSLLLIAPGGLIRPNHVSWKSRLLYSEGYFPEFLLRILLRRRLYPARKEGNEGDRSEGEVVDDASSAFDNAVLDPQSQSPRLTVADVMAWQLDNHPGFIPAYKSTILHAPLYDQGTKEWAPLRGILARRRIGGPGSLNSVTGLRGGKICFVLGETDSVVVASELEEDARNVLGGDDAVVVEVMRGVGHEIGITQGREIADFAAEYWKRLEG